MKSIDMLITNFQGHRLAYKYQKVLIHRGFLNYEEVGNQLKNDVLYEGSCYLLFEAANIISKYKEGH
jgi:nitrogenase molybdenum-iron protein NifN